MLSRIIMTSLVTVLVSSNAYAQNYDGDGISTEIAFAVAFAVVCIIGAGAAGVFDSKPPPRRLTPEELAEETRYLNAQALHFDAQASYDEKVANAALKRVEREEVEAFARQQRQKRGRT